MNPSRAKTPEVDAGLPKPPIAIPTTLTVEQDDEWVVAKLDGRWQEVRLHDYDKLFEVEGLYEHIVYEALECCSPQVVADELEAALESVGSGLSRLRILDLGAGNGCVAEELRRRGVKRLVGLDISLEARDAARRDRPGVYEAYLVDDLTEPRPETEAALAKEGFECLICVAALGFGDIPAEAFARALGCVERGGWVVFTIKADFVNGSDTSGFRRLIDRLLQSNQLDVVRRRPYTHRLATDGRELEYVAFVTRKTTEGSPRSW